MKKPYNWNSLIDSLGDCNSPYAHIVAYYLSRFDRDVCRKLGFGNMTDTHEKIGFLLGIPANTIKNFRNAFDPDHENRRRGWWREYLGINSVSGNCAKVKTGFCINCPK